MTTTRGHRDYVASRAVTGTLPRVRGQQRRLSPSRAASQPILGGSLVGRPGVYVPRRAAGTYRLSEAVENGFQRTRAYKYEGSYLRCIGISSMELSFYHMRVRLAVGASDGDEHAPRPSAPPTLRHWRRRCFKPIVQRCQMHPAQSRAKYTGGNR